MHRLTAIETIRILVLLATLGLALGCNGPGLQEPRSPENLDFRRGMLYYLAGDVRRASWTFERLYRTPSSPAATADAGLFLGRCMLRMNRNGEAAEVFRRTRATGRHPQIRAEAQSGLAEALTRQRRFGEAAAQWRQALDNPITSYYIAADEALVGLARCYRAMGDSRRADALLAQVRSSFTNVPSPYIGAMASSSTPPATGKPSTPPPTGARKGYFVQVSAVREDANARRAAGRLRGMGYPVKMTIGTGGLTLVRVGPYASRNTAEIQRETLRNRGYPSAFVVRAGF